MAISPIYPDLPVPSYIPQTPQLPLRELMYTMDKLDQAYYAGMEATEKAEQWFSDLEVALGDIPDKNMYAAELEQETDNLLAKYQGGYESPQFQQDMFKFMRTKSRDPRIAGWLETKRNVDIYDKVRMELMAAGEQPIDFKPYDATYRTYDPIAGTVNPFVPDVQTPLDLDTRMQTMFDGMQADLYEGKLTQSDIQGLLSATTWQGISNQKILNYIDSAYIRYINTSEGKQQMRVLTELNGMLPQDAELAIRNQLLAVGKERVGGGQQTTYVEDPLAVATMKAQLQAQGQAQDGLSRTFADVFEIPATELGKGTVSYSGIEYETLPTATRDYLVNELGYKEEEAKELWNSNYDSPYSSTFVSFQNEVAQDKSEALRPIIEGGNIGTFDQNGNWHAGWQELRSQLNLTARGESEAEDKAKVLENMRVVGFTYGIPQVGAQDRSSGIYRDPVPAYVLSINIDPDDGALTGTNPNRRYAYVPAGQIAQSAFRGANAAASLLTGAHGGRRVIAQQGGEEYYAKLIVGRNGGKQVFIGTDNSNSQYIYNDGNVAITRAEAGGRDYITLDELNKRILQKTWPIIAVPKSKSAYELE